MKPLITAEHLRLMQALLPVVQGEHWARRDAVAAYVSRCEDAGFADTDDKRRLCALRYLAGKRRVTPPGHARRKATEKARRRQIANVSSDLEAAVSAACLAPAAQQYANGNDKALNALVGQVLKLVKADPGAIHEILQQRLRGEK